MSSRDQHPDTGLRFEASEVTSIRLHPGQDFRRDDVRLEVRRDPITGSSARLAHFGAIHPEPLDLATYLLPEVKGFCPFCPPHRDTLTPQFPLGPITEGRMALGEALLVPNLYPYDVHSTVCIMTRDHVVPLEKIDRQCLVDAFSLGVAAWKRLAQAGSGPAHPVMGWNYMPPSGGGLVHPHQQYLLTDFPGNRYEAELAAARAYDSTHGADPWTVLIRAEEQTAERFLGRTGDWRWLTAFAPRGVLGEILAVEPDVFGLDDLDDERLGHLVDGLLRVFSWMRVDEIFSFNATLFVGPPDQACFPAHLSLVPRTFLNLRDMAPDMNFLQVLMEEPVSVVRPEEMATRLRPFFSS